MIEDLAGKCLDYQLIEKLLPYLLFDYNTKNNNGRWNDKQMKEIQGVILFQIRMTLFDNLPKTKV